MLFSHFQRLYSQEMSKLNLLLALYLFPIILFAKNYHVTAVGSAAGDGSINDPWDIYTAFNAKDIVLPADTILIHQGVYKGRFNVWLEGSSEGHVVITNFKDDQVVLDAVEGGHELGGENVALYSAGAYLIYDGLTFTNSDPSRYTIQEGSFPDKPQAVSGLYIVSPYTIVKNCIIHDQHGTGIGCWNGATNVEIFGNLIYYNGWEAPDRGHGYGLYVQNQDPESKVHIHHNIIFSNFNAGFHVYVTKGTVISNIHIYDNIVFDNGEPSERGPCANNIFVGGLRPLDGIKVLNNHTYLTGPGFGGSLRIGYYEQANKNIEVRGNYMIGCNKPLTVHYCDSLTVEENFFYGKDYWLCHMYENGEQDLTSYNWDHNTYYFAGLRTDYMSGMNWDDWKSTFSFDQNSQFIASAPPRNEYFFKKCEGMDQIHLVVYDWEGLGGVEVDLSMHMKQGCKYLVYDAQNINGAPIVRDTYAGGDVYIPTGLTQIAPIFGEGMAHKPAHTAQEFNAYIIREDNFTSNGSTSLNMIQSERLKLYQNYPNPFSETSTIRFSLGSTSKVKIELYSLEGVLIDILDEGVYLEGSHEVELEAAKYSPGVYYYMLSCQGEKLTKKLVLSNPRN